MAHWRAWRPTFAEGQYDAVYKELHDEIEETSNLHAFVTNLQAVYIGSAVYSLGPVKGLVVDEIERTVRHRSAG